MDPAAVVHADLFDQEAEEFFRLFGVFAGDDFFELVGEGVEGGGVRRRVGVCGEPAGEFGFLLAEGFEPVAVAAHAFLAERG